MYQGVTGPEIHSFTTDLPIDAWFHICVVRDSGNIILYVNGQQVGSPSASTSTGTGTFPLYVGKRPTGSNYRYLDSGFNHLRIVKGRAFTQNEAELSYDIEQQNLIIFES